MKKNNGDLAKRIYDGDQTAECELFATFSKKIATMVQIRLGIKNADWEDVVSDIKLGILIKLREGKFDPEKGNLSAYIHGITLKKINLYLRSGQKDRNHLQDIALDNIPNPGSDKLELEKEELRILMRKIISSLKEKYKEVIYLRFYEELSIPEISDQLQIEPRRVSERINYALKLLQKKCSKTKFQSIFRDNLQI